MRDISSARQTHTQTDTQTNRQMNIHVKCILTSNNQSETIAHIFPGCTVPSGFYFMTLLDVLPPDLVKSRSREIACQNYPIAPRFGRPVGSTAAEAPVKLQSDRISLTQYLATSMSRSDGMASYTHYHDVIMGTIASQITSLTVVYPIVYSDADQSKHQSSASLAFVWGIHRDRWIPRTKGQLRGKCFHLMTSSWLVNKSPLVMGY